MPAKYRADHIGSLLRPAELLQARNASSDTVQLRALEDKHILRVIARQKDLGFKIFTDGELRRNNFMSDFNDAVQGIDEGVAVARTSLPKRGSWEGWEVMETIFTTAAARTRWHRVEGPGSLEHVSRR